MSEDIEYSPAATKEGVLFKGCCNVCKRPIYTGNSHADDCIYG